jgi:uncharacterized membrane protein SpoIIM required for sporulation
VDLDAFVAVHSPEWDRLNDLSRRRRLSGEEVDELVRLYQRAATHLSVVRSSAPQAALAESLSTTVAKARAAVGGAGEPFYRELARFFAVSFPAALWRARWASALCAAFTLVVALVAGTWVAGNRQAQLALFSSDAAIRQAVEVDFEAYYSEFSAAGFGAQVWTNNAWVAAQCVAFGISGVLVVYVLFQNALNVGVIGGVMAANDRLGVFFTFITPHGLLELTAVFIAAGAGLMLFWAWVSPGARTRGQALAEEGRSMITIALGLVVVLLVSGVLEAFVTPSGLPAWLRIAIGAAVWLAFLTYAAVLGRRAAAAGETGDLARELVGDTAPVAG